MECCFIQTGTTKNVKRHAFSSFARNISDKHIKILQKQEQTLEKLLPNK